MKKVLILGAKSDIAKAYATTFAKQGYQLVLAARNIQVLEGFKSTLESVHHIKVSLLEFDVLQTETHDVFAKNVSKNLYGIVCCIGYLGDEQLAKTSTKEAQLIWHTNFIGCANILNILSLKLKPLKSGFIIGVSSVAGNRGRKTNYHYGSAKAGFSAYLSGLRASLQVYGIHVLTVKPGFVKTQMTQNLELPKLLTTSSDVVANKTIKALKRKNNVLYVKWFWRYIMWVIAIIPESIFKKMNL